MDHTSEACGWHRHTTPYSSLYCRYWRSQTISCVTTLHATYYIVQNAWYSISNGKINNGNCIWHTEKSMHINHSSISHLMLPRTNDLTHISSVFVLHVNNWLSNWEVSWAITEQPVSRMQSSKSVYGVLGAPSVCSDVHSAQLRLFVLMSYTRQVNAFRLLRALF